MDWYLVATIVIGISALAAVFNARILKLPDTIGLMATGLVASLLFLTLGTIYPPSIEAVCEQVERFDFSSFVLEFALGFLIFAGAFMSDSQSMSRERWPILLFATIGIILSTFIVGILAFGLLRILGVEIPLIHCLLFGALISPTDPIAVLAILKDTAVPKKLQADIAGESLLNDGVAVVIFLTILQIAGGGDENHGSGGSETNFGSVAILFFREVVGGAILGLGAGWLGKLLIRLARQPAVDMLVSLAVVMGTFAVASLLQVSGPLALVATGLLLGNFLKSNDLDRSEKKHLTYFWEGIDHILNAVLFTLMGLVLLSLSDQFEWVYFVAGILAIPIVIVARLISVGLTIPFTKLRSENPKTTLSLLTWGGLRGGISIALALVLSEEQSSNLILHMTYVVVAFSILVQGLTISPLVNRLNLG